MANKSSKAELSVIKFESGHSKVEKVPMETKLGKARSQIRCKIQKFVKRNVWTSKISSLIMSRKKTDSRGNSLGSLHVSTNDTEDKCVTRNENNLIDKSGDCVRQEKIIDNLTVPAPQCADFNNRPFHVHKKSKEKFTINEGMTVNRNVFQTFYTENVNEVAKKESASIDDDIISSSYQMLPNQLGQSSEVTIQDDLTSMDEEKIPNRAKDAEITIQEENKDSAIQQSNEDDLKSDDARDLNHSLKIEENMIKREYQPVMSALEALPADEENRRHPRNEDPVIKSSAKKSCSRIVDCYIDSGLRRLESEKSCLRLNPDIYETKKQKLEQVSEDQIKPTLRELPSDVFQRPKVCRRKKIAEPEKKQEVLETSSNEEEKSEELEGNINEERLQKLKEIEDKSFKLEAKDLMFTDNGIHNMLFPSTVTPENSSCSLVVSSRKCFKNQDVCVHLYNDREKKIKTSFYFDYRIHTTEPQKDTCSVSTSTSSSLVSKSDKMSNSSQGSSSASHGDSKESTRSKRKKHKSKNWWFF